VAGVRACAEVKIMTTRFSRLIALIALFAMLHAQAISAWQKPDASKDSQEFKFTVSTHLVLVPVIVTDKQGKHVTGLKAEDFEVKEDGAVQKIARLDELTADTVKVQATSGNPKSFTNQVAAEHPKKLEIIALDQINTPFVSGAQGYRGLVEFLAKNVDANTLLALVAITPNGVQIIHNFTTDPSVLVAAVGKVRATLNSKDTRSQDIPGESSESDAEAVQLTALLGGSSVANIAPGSSNALIAQARAAMQQAHAAADASRETQASLITLECLQQIAQYFQGVPGRKSLIWASTGFKFSLGSAPESLTRGTTNEDWQRTFNMLQDANIAMYPVDVGGLVQGVSANNLQSLDSAMIRSGGADGGVGTGGGGRQAGLEAVNNGSLVDPTVGRQQTMRTLADMTGGQAFYNSNDASGLFRKAGEDASQYYLLSYYTHDNGKKGWRKLAVKVRQDNVKVRGRTGYFFSSVATEAETTRQADEMMAMASDLDFTGLPVRGEWQEVTPAGDQRTVRFLLSIPAGVPSIDTENGNHINFDFRAMVMDSKGQIVAKIGQRMETKLPPDGVTQIQTKGLDYINEFTLPPGSYRAHFVVRDNLRGTLGSIVTPLTVQ
jgi:VWFA-related protein